MDVPVMVAVTVAAIDVLRLMHHAFSCKHGRQPGGLRRCCERQR